jgi:2-succinyl-5-enolpyruvyl-6-hydroxy-3-cyclohexene-1-carboxylate synthase
LSELPQHSAASDFALDLLRGFLAAGVRHLVLAPGSRSQALALAASRLDHEGALQVHVRIDERVAGFTALGLARESRRPVAVLCTSGTAAANLMPAAMEAFHSGVPLVLLTADRPPELRGVGANQATAQVGLFSAFARLGLDVPTPGDALVDGDALAAKAVAASLGVDDGTGVCGPVHLNLPTREPLSGALPERIEIALGDCPAPPALQVFEVSGTSRTIVIAGADAGPTAEAFARAGGWPLVAEIVSGARFGPNLVPDYRLRLTELGSQVQRAVVFGHPTLSREVTSLLSREAVEVIAVRGTGEALNLNGRSKEVAAVRASGGPTDAEWLAAWVTGARIVAKHPEPQLNRSELVQAVWRATKSADRLMFGSSRLVRVADEVLESGMQNVHSNRGLAGIDGTVATGIGIALASQAANPESTTRVLLGDLALLHDVGALLLPADEPAPRIQVIIGNDRGGTIFDSLEVAGTASRADLDRVFYTPHSVGIAQLAAAYGWQFLRTETEAELEQALESPTAEPQLIEAPLYR